MATPSLSPADLAFPLSPLSLESADRDEDDMGYAYAPSFSSDSSLASPCSDFHIDTGSSRPGDALLSPARCPPPPPGTPTSPYVVIHSPLVGEGESLSYARTEVRTASPANSTGSRTSSKKGAHYKTKPCKFYHTSGSCNKGDKCAFIHEPPRKLSTSSSSSTDTQREVPKQYTPPTMPRLRKEVLSDTEKGKPNFFPVTWRVISGGVMMGGQREVCHDFMEGRCDYEDDCRFSHPGNDDAKRAPSPDYFGWSPVGVHYDFSFPVYANTPPVSEHVAFDVPTIEEPPRHRAKPRKIARKLTIVPPHLTSSLREYSPHKYLDGNTLLAREQDMVAEVEDASTSNDASGLELPVDARTLVRPVSTPPIMVRNNIEVVTLFAAEAP